MQGKKKETWQLRVGGETESSKNGRGGVQSIYVFAYPHLRTPHKKHQKLQYCEI